MNVQGKPVFNLISWNVLSNDLTERNSKPPVSWEVNFLSRVWLFVIPWTVAYQAPPSLEFSRQGYWSGLPFPSPGYLPDPGDWTQVFHIAATSLTLTNQIHRKVSYITKAVLAFKSSMSLLFSSGRLDVATIQVSQGKMTAFGCHTPIPGSQKISPCSFKAV